MTSMSCRVKLLHAKVVKPTCMAAKHAMVEPNAAAQQAGFCFVAMYSCSSPQVSFASFTFTRQATFHRSPKLTFEALDLEPCHAMIAICVALVGSNCQCANDASATGGFAPLLCHSSCLPGGPDNAEKDPLPDAVGEGFASDEGNL